MRNLQLAALAGLFAVLMTSGGTASAQAKRFPMSSAAYREMMDKTTAGLAGACQKMPDCTGANKTKFDSGLALMKIRILEVCRDGTVTALESEWVFAAMPELHHSDQH